MKNFKLLSVLAISLMAFAFTSCDTGGDSFQWPTIDEQKSMISNLGYMQDGSIIYYNENADNKKDVTDTIPNIMVTMSTGINKDDNGSISNYYGNASFMFPVKILSNFINDEKLAKAISEMSPVSAKAYLIPYQYANQSFIANVDDIKLGDIKINENTTYKDVTIKFTAGYYTAGYATSSNTSKQYFYILMGAASIYVNNSQNNLLTSYKGVTGNYPPQFLFTTDTSK